MNLRATIASRPVFFFLTACEGAFLLSWIMRIPPDVKNQFWLGYSAQRLLLIGGMILLIVLLTAAGFGSLKYRSFFYRKLTQWISKSSIRNGLKAIGLLAGMLGWLCAWMPGYQLGYLQYYFERLLPGLIWLGITGLQLFIAIVWSDGGPYSKIFSDTIKQDRSVFAAAGLALLAFLLAWGFVLITRIGITSDDRFWNVAGVPILGVQVYLSWMGLTACLLLARQARVLNWIRRWRRWLDVVILVGLWAAAFLLWSGTPILPYVTNPKPVQPNMEYYPYSDAIWHDIGGQYILLGQGVYNHAYTDKPLYMLLIAGFHALAGQSYVNVIQLQVALLALIPVGLYLLGREYQSRPLGALAAVLAIIKEYNALVSVVIISGANSKQMMTEPFAELGVIVFAWLVIRWLKSAPKARLAPLWAGGALGLTTLIRPNPFLLWPILIVFALLVYRKNWRPWLASSTLMTIVMVLALLPWVLTATDGAGNSYFKLKFIDVFQVRYLEQSVVPPVMPSGIDGTPILAAGGWEANKIGGIVGNLGQQTTGTMEQIHFILEHTMHNVVASVLILPNTFQYGDLVHTLNQPFWVEVPAWTGTLTNAQVIFLLVDLGVIACGIGWAWKRARWVGLVPAVVFMGYALANGLARTSGSRYLVPMDWVVYFYFCAGLVLLTEVAIVWLWGSPPLTTKIDTGSAVPSGFPYGKAAGISLLFLAIGGLLPLVSVAIPPRYANLSQADLKSKVQQQIDPQTGNFSKSEWDAFLQAPDTVFVEGLELYPRYFQASRGEFEFYDYPYESKEFDRLIVEVLAPAGPKGVILPVADAPTTFPNGGDILAVGCKNNDSTIVAVAFVVKIAGKESVYWVAPPPAELSCSAMSKIY
jgi:hypothetical protein